MAEVLAHQGLDPLLQIAALGPEGLGHFLLQIVAQHVDVAPALDVQHRSDAEQEILGLLQLLRRTFVFGLERRRLQRADVPRRGDVAQAAGRALDVGLELIEGAVERRVALIDQRQERIEQHAALFLDDLRGPGANPLKHPGVARDQPQIEQRDQEFRVAEVRLAELVELAHVMADGQAEIPERLQDRVDETFFRRANRLLEEEQQIDVGMERQRPAAVAADRADRQRGAGVFARQLRELLHDGVDLTGVPGLHVAPGASLPRRCNVLLPRRRERPGHLLPVGVSSCRRG